MLEKTVACGKDGLLRRYAPRKDVGRQNDFQQRMARSGLFERQE
mgnify:CR=1 FL=1